MMARQGLGGRLPLQTPEGLAAPARALYDRLLGDRLGRAAPFRSSTDAGELIGPFNACLYAPEIGGGFIDFHEAEERGTPLSARLREIVILSVGGAWGSAYELYAHKAVAASKAGFAPDAVQALACGEPSAGLSEQERALQAFTLEVARDRRVSDATYATAESLLGRDGVVAAAFLAAAYTGTCMMLNIFAVPAPDPAP